MFSPLDRLTRPDDGRGRAQTLSFLTGIYSPMISAMPLGPSKGIFLGLMLVAAAAAQEICTGDCDANGEVTVDEIVIAVNVALGNADADECAAADVNADGSVTVDEILNAITHALNGCAVPSTLTPPAAPTPTATVTPTLSFDPQNPPADARELRAWLQAGTYLGWHAESGIHPSGGPHGGSVRTYMNDAVFDSLVAGNAAHPRGAAVVKELYFGTATVQLWAVAIKVDDDSAGGNGWYWYEGASLSGRGLRACTQCHASDYRQFISKDFVLTPFPLQ